MHTTRDTLYLVEFRQARLRRAKHRWIWPRSTGWLLHRPVIKRGKERRRDKGLTKEEEKEKEEKKEEGVMREEEGRRSRKGEKSDEHEVR